MKATGLTYVLAEFWATKADFDAAKPVLLTEEFMMQLRPTGRRIVTNEDGWLKTTGGAFIDPETLDSEQPEPKWEREIVTRDVPAEIEENIAAYWEKAKALNLSGDHTSDATKPLYKDGKLVPQKLTTPLVERDATDPHSILKRADVKALKGKGFEKAVASSQL
ncbi:hypothetical protein LCGC14_0444960 [marine sediment metagenome]|uniref:Uncharacterized protein n=1 Tax=marine sediment metagenome TaxID=412755 RepID=A0A0F9SQ32_9ZZZZ